MRTGKRGEDGEIWNQRRKGTGTPFFSRTDVPYSLLALLSISYTLRNTRARAHARTHARKHAHARTHVQAKKVKNIPKCTQEQPSRSSVHTPTPHTPHLFAHGYQPPAVIEPFHTLHAHAHTHTHTHTHTHLRARTHTHRHKRRHTRTRTRAQTPHLA